MHAVHAILLLLLLLVPLGVPVLTQWPWYLLAPLAAYGLIVCLVRPLRQSVARLRIGRFDRRVFAVTTGIVLVSSAALGVWQIAVQQDFHEQVERLPAWSQEHWVWAGLLFAVVNALLEEIVFRGILWESLTVELGPSKGILAQAVLFGIGHLHGVPEGLVGVGMVTVYGVVLGWLRWVAGGLGAPVIAHVFADATVFTLIVCGSKGLAS
jgi:membrane protease YdiL (CAAX protease family)